MLVIVSIGMIVAVIVMVAMLSVVMVVGNLGGSCWVFRAQNTILSDRCISAPVRRCTYRDFSMIPVKS
ncbi:MAG: hypothetical protein DWP92_07230 [Armatimonadetes bacterium]|nr:MAG: hypothetical protein DWP92_07230 [Armatimonadota bacterium]